MSDIELKRWENALLDISLWVIIYKKEFYFFAKEVASTLGFTNPKEAVVNHVDKQDITTLKELLGDDFKTILKENFQGGSQNIPPSFFQNIQPHQKIMNEYGIYALCMKSKLEAVRPFQRWVYEIIKTIRITGTYSLLNVEQLFLEETPAEKIRSTIPEIPEFIFSGDNGERKEMHDEYKDDFDKSKNPKNVDAGGKGGTKTQQDIKDLKNFVRNTFDNLKEILDLI